MKKSKKRRTSPACSVVATAHTVRGLREAAALGPRSGIDLVEIRADCLAGKVPDLPRALRKIKRPLIITARHPLEGGAGNLTASDRAALLEALLPHAAFIDVELRSVARCAAIMRRARRLGVGIIISIHDFSRTPGPVVLRQKLRQGMRCGATVVKIATTLRGPRDLATLLVLQAAGGDRLATMGMGKLGKVSRLALPLAGSRFVYGYLDRPQVDGQWPAAVLASRLAEAAG